MTVARTAHATALPASRTQRLTATLLACLLGAGLVFMAGFSHIDALHNGAHDTRHSEGFPCH